VITSVVFNPDGKKVLTASWDKTAKLWDVQTGKLLQSFEGHKGFVHSAVFSPDGSRVVTSSEDGTARVWRIDGQNKTSIALRGHTGPVESAVFSADGSRIATSSADQTTRVWSFGRGSAESVELAGHTDLIRKATFSPDGRYLATASYDGTARVWALGRVHLSSIALVGHSAPVENPEVMSTYTSPTEVVDVAFSPNGARLVTASIDGTARVWAVDGERPAATVLTGHTDRVEGAVFSPNGHYAVTASSDHTARIWRLGYDRLTYVTLRGHKDRVWSVAVSPDGKWIFTASADGTAQIWPSEGGKSVMVFSGQTDIVRDSVFSADGQTVFTTSMEGNVWAWSLRGKRTPQLLYNGHGNLDDNFAVSPSGECFVVVTASPNADTAEIHKMDGSLLKSVKLIDVSKSPIAALAVSADCERLFAGFYDDRVSRIWSLSSTSEQPIRLTGHTGEINSAEFSSDGERLVTSSSDKTARLWNLKGRHASSVILNGHKDEVSSAKFSTDGQSVVTASWDGTARIWTTRSNTRLFNLAERVKTRCLTDYQLETAGFASRGRKDQNLVVSAPCY
jgi:WD40 repeat protein